MFLFSEIVQVVRVRLDPFLGSMIFSCKHNKKEAWNLLPYAYRRSFQSKNCVINKVFVLSLHTAAPVAKSRNLNDIIS